MKIGRLEEVELRELWKHEATDFTHWLAQAENLELLSDEVGLTLVEPVINHGVGKFLCDIVCRDEQSGQVVVIENQLEQTDQPTAHPSHGWRQLLRANNHRH